MVGPSSRFGIASSEFAFVGEVFDTHGTPCRAGNDVRPRWSRILFLACNREPVHHAISIEHAHLRAGVLSLAEEYCRAGIPSSLHAYALSRRRGSWNV